MLSSQKYFRPFHEVIVEAIEAITEPIEVRFVATMLKEVLIPRDHDRIIEAWEKRMSYLHGEGTSRGKEVVASLREQKRRVEMRDEVRQKLLTFLVELSVKNLGEISDTTRLSQDLGIGEAAGTEGIGQLLALRDRIESGFEVRLPREWPPLRIYPIKTTVGELVNLICEVLERKAA
ncbi:MAG: hypothetical protein AAB455_01720 [Patescibacteria group bacterium]